MSENALQVLEDNAERFYAALRELTHSEVLVGIPETKDVREDTHGEIGNAGIGYIMENGAPEMNTPARPFLSTGVVEGKEAIVAQLAAAGREAFSGDKRAVMRRLNAAGLAAQSAVRNKIVTGPFAPLSERTLAARKRRGVTRTDPLKDTGQLLKSISYVVRSK